MDGQRLVPSDGAIGAAVVEVGAVGEKSGGDTAAHGVHVSWKMEMEYR